ncbi:MAG: polysaccharide biosynthesis/export family protein [Gammaproteobacteria bacterium]|nr:polysaccharide biosynthesis/export family protein [Gammaproteobacteria bacterium]
MIKNLLTSLSCLLLAACAGLGYRFDQGHYQVAQQNEPQRIGQFTIEPITPALLLKLNAMPDPAAAPRANPALAQALKDYRYRVGPQDVLRIIVWNHPELTFPQFSISNTDAGLGSAYSPAYGPTEENGFVVSSDGSIFFPYVGDLPVAGLTTGEIRAKLSQALVSYIKDPQINVTVVGFHSQQYQLAGVVMKPGLYPVTNVPITVSQAIDAAGGAIRSLPSTTDPSTALSMSLADLGHVILINGQNRQVLNLRDFYQYGNQQQDRLVQAGDIIEVPDNSFDQVHLIGEVLKPGNYAISGGQLNLAQVLGEAGGLNLNTANPARIFVFRGAYEQPRVFWLNARSPDTMLLATRFELKPQDVVFVATSGLGAWNRVVSQILPTVQTLYETKVIGNF